VGDRPGDSIARRRLRQAESDEELLKRRRGFTEFLLAGADFCSARSSPGVDPAEGYPHDQPLSRAGARRANFNNCDHIRMKRAQVVDSLRGSTIAP